MKTDRENYIKQTICIAKFVQRNAVEDEILKKIEQARNNNARSLKIVILEKRFKRMMQRIYRACDNLTRRPTKPLAARDALSFTVHKCLLWI